MIAVYIIMDVLIVVLVLALIGIIARPIKRKRRKRYNVKRNVEAFKKKDIYEKAKREKEKQAYYSVGDYYPATNYISRKQTSNTSPKRQNESRIAQRLNEQAQYMNNKHAEQMMNHVAVHQSVQNTNSIM